MDIGLYQGAAAVALAERRMEVITSNLANLSTDGFKRQALAVESFEDRLRRGTGSREIGSRTRVVSRTDFSQGLLRETGNPFDLALVGAGFFAVEGPQGEVYTRAGSFHTDERGTLLTHEGYQVAWEGGRGNVDPLGVEPSIDGSGTVWQGDENRGQLRIVDFARPQELRLTRGGYFTASEEPQASSAQVRQGSLESANATAIEELVALITVQRSLEATTRLLGAIDQTYRRLSQPR
jgi:flagellar basal body rod protein FlgG